MGTELILSPYRSQGHNDRTGHVVAEAVSWIVILLLVLFIICWLLVLMLLFVYRALLHLFLEMVCCS